MKIYKNKILYLTVFATFAIIYSCKNKNVKIETGNCYIYKNNKIYYTQNDSSGKTQNIELEDINPEKFTIIKNENPKNICVNADIWVKDKLSVYFKHKKIKGADPLTFKILEFGYAIDKNKVFFKENIIPGAKPDKLNLLGDYFAADDSNIWFMGRKTTGISDIKNLKIIDGYFAKDSKNIYIINDTNFIIAKNTNIKYFKPAVIKNAELFPEIKFYSDSNKVILFENGITTPAGYRFVIFNTQPQNFIIYPEKNYFSDGKNIYYGRRIIPEAHIETFKPLGQKFAKDKNNVYFKNKIISNNPDTFKLPQNTENKFNIKTETVSEN